jgi:transposase
VRGKPASPVLRGGRRSNAPPLPDRGVRPAKTQQKISGRLTSEETTQDRLDIRSYIDTARKHGQDILTVLHRLMLGDPWTPPAPACS